jgi:hypothetical protein
MVTRGTGGVLITQAVEQPVNGGGMVAHFEPTIDDQDTWNIWARAHVDVLRREFEDVCGALNSIHDGLEDKLAAQARKIAELELRCAELRGVVDTLRAVGSGGINHRGAYDAGTSYARHDVAMLDGSSFIATRDCPGPCPGDGWRLLASCGRRGQRGPIGRSADAPRWVDVAFDAETLSFVPRLSDGSLGSVISLRRLFACLTIDRANYAIVLELNNGSKLSFSVRGLFERYDQEKSGDVDDDLVRR